LVAGTVGVGIAVVLGLVMMAMVAVVGALGSNCGSGTPTTVTAPAGSVKTMGEMVGYLESQSVPAVDAAGIVGNLMQESGLNPVEAGYGLAQWNPGWWPLVSSWIRGQGQDPNSAGGQLMYIAANVSQDVDGEKFYSGLRTNLAHASTPQQAAIVWMNDYEQCRGAGAPGSLSFNPLSPCLGEQRETYAAQALAAAKGSRRTGGTMLASLTPSGTCNASYPLTGSVKGYTNPLGQATGVEWERTDEGVDAAMQPGSPILALAPSKVIEIVPNFNDQPALVCRITAGPLQGKWWYVGEQIQPTVAPGQTVAAGQTVATYAPTGTAIELGWWEPNGRYPLGHPGYEEGLATNAGADFRFLLQALGANPGTGARQSAGTTLGNTYYPAGNPGPGPA